MSEVTVAGQADIKAVIPTQETILKPVDVSKQQQQADPSLPARTTFQEDLTTAGQRKINLVWEITQAIIAMLVVITTMGVSALVAYYHNVGVAGEVPNIIAVAFGTVVGFYFSRTNHQAIGGVGKKANEEQTYEGR